ncbi:MAG: MFS transporter [Thermomicrobiales bacterium]|nr:MFS transporter [Thermomicrobiales bacterium]
MLGLFGFLETSIGPAMPFIRDRLDIGYTAASLHFSAFAAGGITIGIVGDRIVGRLGRTRTIWFGMAGMAAGVTVLALGPFIALTMLGTYVTGVCGTLALISNQSSLSDIHGEKRTVAIAESNVVASSAAVLAPLAVGGLDDAGVGWQLALMVGLPVYAMLFVTFRGISLPNQVDSAAKANPNAPLPRAYWIFWSVLFMVSAVEWCLAFWGADYLDEEVGLRKAAAATAMSIFFGAMVAGRLLGARLAAIYPGPGLLIAAIAIALAGFPIFWLSGDRPLLSLVGLFVAGVGIANFYPLTIAAAAGAAPAQPDLATARLAISGAGALLTMPLLVGVISDVVGMRWGFGVVMPLLILALLATVAGRREMPPVA